jgi:hypothetical protein
MSPSASGAKMTSRVTLGRFQVPGVTRAERGKNLVRGLAPPWIRLHRVVDRNDLLAKPALNHAVAFL